MTRITLRGLVFLGVLCASVLNTRADNAPCISGTAVGGKPGPYTFHVATGPQRGQLTCYVCDTAERPAMVVFARSMSDPLAKVVQGMDKALADHKGKDLRAWVTFLSDDQTSLDPKLVEWSKKHWRLREVPLGVFEDLGGPPTYKIARDADVTVLVYVKNKVVSNFAFRAGESTDAKVEEVLRTLPTIVGK